MRDRMKIVVESFFPGYLFVQLAADANWAPLRTTTIAEPVFEVGDSVQYYCRRLCRTGCQFMAMEGEKRMILLLEMLNRQQQIAVPLVSIVKN